MKDQPIKPEQVMAGLLAGLSRNEQMALMARLEFGGGHLYRAWAEVERNAKAREALVAAADREDENAKLLRLMTEPKGKCEKCAKPLASEERAFACSFQCTFCAECEAGYNHVCPNCGGELALRRAA